MSIRRQPNGVNMSPKLSVEHKEAGFAYHPSSISVLSIRRRVSCAAQAQWMSIRRQVSRAAGPVRGGAGLCGALQSLGTEYGKMGHTEEPYIPFQRVLAMNYLPGSSPSKYFRHCKA